MLDIDVFISYHTKSSRSIVEAICNVLESSKIKCWYAPRNVESQYAGDIVRAIRNCKIFLLILNQEASNSQDVLNEINEAFERLRAKEEFYILPFHISNQEISPDASYYLRRLHWIDAIDPPMEKRIEELRDRICFLLKMPVQNNQIKLTQEELKNSTILNNHNFIGRKVELEKIHEILTTEQKVFITGMGGIGKSEIVKKYANIYREEYDTIIFLSFDTSIINTILNSPNLEIENITRKQKENGQLETDKEYFERKLKKLKELASTKMLIIVDNFDTDQDEELLNLLNGNYHMIFTTRNDFKEIGIQNVKIDAFQDQDEQLKLFEQNYGRKVKDENIPALLKIFKLVQGHTLIIELLAKVMKETRQKPQEMLKELTQNGIASQNEIVEYHQKTTSVKNCLYMLYDISALSETQKNILMNLTFFPISGFDFEEFMDLCHIETGKEINKLIKKSWIIHDWVRDTIALHPLISELIIEQCHPNLDNCKILFKELTQKDSWQIKSEQRKIYGSVIHNIYTKFPNVTKDNIPNYINIAKFFRDLEYYDLALKITFDILEKQKEIYGKFSHEVAKTCDLIRFIYNKSYQIDKANEWNEKAIEILRKTNTDQNYLLADCLKSRAFSYIKIGKAQNAIPLLEESYNIFSSTLESNHRKIGSTYLAMSRAYAQLKDYQKALEYAQKSYDIFVLRNTKDSDETQTALLALGVADGKIGNFDKSLKEINEVIEYKESFFNKTDFSLLSSYEALANLYMDNQQYSKAIAPLEKMINIFKDKVDVNDFWYKRTQNNLEKCLKETSCNGGKNEKNDKDGIINDTYKTDEPCC